MEFSILPEMALITKVGVKCESIQRTTRRKRSVNNRCTVDVDEKYNVLTSTVLRRVGSQVSELGILLRVFCKPVSIMVGPH